MKRILPTDPPIPNTIDRDAKRAERAQRREPQRCGVLTYTMRAGRATDAKTRRSAPRSSAASFWLSHDTDNRSDGAEDAHFEGNSREEGKRVKVKIKGTRHLGQPQLGAAHDHGHE